MNTFDYRKYVYDNPLLKEGGLEENTDPKKAMLTTMKAVGKALDAAEDKVKPSPKDKEVNEIGVLSIGAALVGAPGLISALGKGANIIGKAFGKDKNVVGEFFKEQGKNLEEYYLKSIAGWLHARYPNKYKGQWDEEKEKPTSKNTELHKAAEKTYAAMLIAAAGVAGFDAASAKNAVVSGVEGGMALLKGKEVADIVSKLS
jgi:hypothetical protein